MATSFKRAQVVRRCSAASRRHSRNFKAEYTIRS